MSNLLQVFNKAREEAMNKHYDAAIYELKDKVVNEPLKTTFLIYSGCVSKDVASEIAFRFNEQGIKASLCTTLMQKFYLEVEVNLPENLIHKKSEVIMKEQEQPQETMLVTEN